jgi:hypothetical protein
VLTKSLWFLEPFANVAVTERSYLRVAVGFLMSPLSASFASWFEHLRGASLAVVVGLMTTFTNQLRRFGDVSLVVGWVGVSIRYFRYFGIEPWFLDG